jgi:hypothetical protein
MIFRAPQKIFIVFFCSIDMVQSHPDILFTTKTEAQPNLRAAVPEATISGQCYTINYQIIFIIYHE